MMRSRIQCVFKANCNCGLSEIKAKVEDNSFILRLTNDRTSCYSQTSLSVHQHCRNGWVLLSMHLGISTNLCCLRNNYRHTHKTQNIHTLFPQAVSARCEGMCKDRRLSVMQGKRAVVKRTLDSQNAHSRICSPQVLYTPVPERSSRLSRRGTKYITQP